MITPLFVRIISIIQYYQIHLNEKISVLYMFEENKYAILPVGGWISWKSGDVEKAGILFFVLNNNQDYRRVNYR